MLTILRPTDFEGKKVLVVGLANTGADTATQLMGHAHKIYVSHRHGTYVVSKSFIANEPTSYRIDRFRGSQKENLWIIP
jgi:cation diffusion facilitator CzcD-associated flavoprotein CzcO